MARMTMMPSDVLDTPTLTTPQAANTPSTRVARTWQPSTREDRFPYKTLNTRENRLFKLTRRCWDEQYIFNPHAKKANGDYGKNVKMKSPDNIGRLMGILDRMNPRSHEEWQELYLHERHLDISRTAKALREQMELGKYGNIKLTATQARDIVLTRVVDETWTGYGVELYFINRTQLQADAEELIGGRPTTLRRATGHEEQRWGADIVAEQWHGIVALYQIKPLSYFRGNNPSLRRDRFLNHKRNELAYKETAARVEYFAYDYDPRVADAQELYEMSPYVPEHLKDNEEANLLFKKSRQPLTYVSPPPTTLVLP